MWGTDLREDKRQDRFFQLCARSFIDSEHEINLSEKGLEVFHSRHFLEV